MGGAVRAIVILCFVACLATACAGSSSDKAGGNEARRVTVTVLRLANGLGSSDELNAFAAGVASLSRGTLAIRIVDNWEARHADSEIRLIRDVEEDKADLGSAGSRAWDAVGVLDLRALHAPLLITTYRLQARVLEGSIGTELTRSVGRAGVVGLAILPGPMRRLFARHRLAAERAYVGEAVGVQESRVASRFFRLLGARPIWFPSHSNVARFAMIEQQIASVQSNGYDAFQRYLIANVVLWPRPLVLFANRRRFDALTAQQRKILQEAATNAGRQETRVIESMEATSLATLCRGGRMRITEASRPDVAAIERAAAQVGRWLETDSQTRRMIDRIKAIKAVHPAYSDPQPHCPRP
jgi:TRAP-type C4-dicarboxylate transport system substrate-binding protein